MHSVPAHNHTLGNHTHGTGNSSYPYFGVYPPSRLLKGLSMSGSGYKVIAVAEANNATVVQNVSAATGNTGTSSAFNTTSIGSGTAHNNMPPYLAVYMWKRTA